MSTKNIVILFIYACLITGCGSIGKKETNFSEQPNIQNDDKTSSHSIKNILYENYRKWQGVRYRFGGLSQDGIDCSGLVHVVYKKGLGKELPRTASQQSRLGKVISKNDLKSGDLVFFKTKRSNHVGIYLENRKFIHASRTRGVTISRLDNNYWKSKYWKSVRI
ncbi:C40 family peptidase [Nitrosomonas sp. Nm33]|uniref:C40 family peptidase n=1 Tax=Nitrosomonas sp. Nm33 TaxID=133724 RepID=UPI00089CC3A8|nr:NlpC/P60 family protein [Nitrosomonas sp. Nm33]SDX87728.1 lipoprotein Spr/probable lipoprotein NlpC [Nitrosomonas sp. Nm33]